MCHSLQAVVSHSLNWHVCTILRFNTTLHGYVRVYKQNSRGYYNTVARFMLHKIYMYSLWTVRSDSTEMGCAPQHVYTHYSLQSDCIMEIEVVHMYIRV